MNEIRVAERSRRRNSVGLNVGGMGGVAGLYGFFKCPRRLVMLSGVALLAVRQCNNAERGDLDG